MNEQFPATDVQFTRLIQFRQAGYELASLW
jgi:hypothetical protein